ncbi:glycosyltransferase family 39 protein [Pseudenhygromyxa sp. WMMC2535]|uniref:ArnT family glycosyltransferase n=1 Tax=Pseudenhygromyxa sp. WMMC2535 TaxID=2712867 RepID=UPI001553C16C|nr:glycosyltransferase family 39 protein [Pseudenhygromyxa sp. WMMC2535]NVB37564.1 glycosyltransferase family 39 protein [Pseudenhygromyxa sp. WMMC2535]
MLRRLAADPATRLQPSDGARWDAAFDMASALLGALVLMLIALTFQDYGITWDETWHMSYGRHVIHWYASGFEDDTALYYRADYLYGGGFDGLGYLARQISPLDKYATIHLFGALIGALGLLGTWKLGRLLGGPAGGFVSLLLLVLTPVWYGHMFANPKDLPFAVGYVWALYYLLRIFITLPAVPGREWVKASLALGAAMSVRIAGLLTICYLLMLIGLWILWRAREARDARLIPQYILRYLPPFALTSLGAWALMLVLWPWAQLAPFRRPLIALARMSAFNLHERNMPFGARRVSTLNPPGDYLLRYFGFKLPELVIALVLGALVVFVVRLVRLRRRAKSERLAQGGLTPKRRRQARVLAKVADPKLDVDTPLARERRLLAIWGFLAFAILFPPLYAIAKRSPLYDGLRHFLFLVPLFVVIAGVTLAALTRRVARRSKAAAWGLQAVVLAHCLRMVVAMIQVHPYQYLWFNGLVGGLPGAYLRYSTDYYGATYKEAYEDLREHLWETERERFLLGPYVVSACMPEFVAKEYLGPNFEWRRRSGPTPEFWLGYTRNNCYLQKEEHPEVLRVERQGVMLNMTRDRRAEDERDMVSGGRTPPKRTGTKKDAQAEAEAEDAEAEDSEETQESDAGDGSDEEDSMSEGADEVGDAGDDAGRKSGSGSSPNRRFGIEPGSDPTRPPPGREEVEG